MSSFSAIYFLFTNRAPRFKIRMRILTLENSNLKFNINVCVYIYTSYIYTSKLYPKDLDIIC